MRIIAVVVAIFSFQVWAQSSQQERIQSSYQKNNQTYDIYCEVFDTTRTLLQVRPIDKVHFRAGQFLSKNFLLNTSKGELNFKVVVTPDHSEKRAQFQVTFSQNRTFKGGVEEGAGRLYKKEIKIKDDQSSFYRKHKLNTLSCYVEFAHAPPFEFSDNNLMNHISVHPQGVYDYKRLLKNAIENYFSDDSYQSIVLLEDGNYKENLVKLYDFLVSGNISLPINNYKGIEANIPLDVPMIVSASGHNRYRFNTDKTVTVRYSGGNQNYCMWNNSRKLIRGLMEGLSSASIEIEFDASANVVQCGRGIIRGIGISCRDVKKSNTLAAFLNKDEKKALKYHQAYYQYFKNVNIPFYKHRFKKVTLSYESKLLRKRTVISGSGDRELHISFKYVRD
jgi:hypothetical protein